MSLKISSVATVLTVYGIETDNLIVLYCLCLRTVATVLTVYGIETIPLSSKEIPTPSSCNSTYRLRYWNMLIWVKVMLSYIILLQQYLPFTVLKQEYRTAYWAWCELQQYLPFTVLKPKAGGRTLVDRPCCNSTYRLRYWNFRNRNYFDETYMLQQYLPFTVLKRTNDGRLVMTFIIVSCNSTYRLRYWNPDKPLRHPFQTLLSMLQQYLPFTVLKQSFIWNAMRYCILIVATVLTVYGIETKLPASIWELWIVKVATVLTVYGIETHEIHLNPRNLHRCNSTYRLRYWNYLQYSAQLSASMIVATVLTVYGIETISKNLRLMPSISLVATVLTVYGIETRWC